MNPKPRLSLSALVAAGLLGFTACAQSSPPAANPAAAPADPAPAGIVPPPAPAASGKGDAPESADRAKAPVPALSPEDQAKARWRRQTDRFALEKAGIDAELALAELKARRAREGEIAERTRIDAEAALAKARLAAESLSAEESRLESERRMALADARSRLDQVKELNKARLLEADTKLARQQLDNELAVLGAESARVKREVQASKILEKAPDYPSQPFSAGVLRLSDRRIDLNGPITEASSRAVVDLLAFHNRRDPAAPIFIVIDNSPGGSLMSGYQVLQAIAASKAPVHVVVRGTASDVAAVILALAPHSYVTERAFITHHQQPGGARGNLGELRDTVRQLDRWYRRINEPVAARMGLSLDEFVKRMFEKNAKGNWSEFGEAAVKLHWADHVVSRIIDDSVDELAAAPAPSDMRALTGGAADVQPRKDKDGKTYFLLPPLTPGDAWSLSAPDGLYRPSL